jgi:hypothetical protein
MAFYRRSKAVAMANISASRQGTKAVAKKYLGETASVLHVLGGRRRRVRKRHQRRSVRNKISRRRRQRPHPSVRACRRKSRSG